MVSGRVRTKAEEEKPEKGGGSLEGQGKDTWDKRLRSRAAAILGRKKPNMETAEVGPTSRLRNSDLRVESRTSEEDERTMWSRRTNSGSAVQLGMERS
mmetsp:Transcript_10472/g.64073  ORF Transcript_10472/g.64073 Transcript_10472/m.64073 type:complete len:98 (-) Transcript_10472:2142-2435(-)